MSMITPCPPCFRGSNGLPSYHECANPTYPYLICQHNNFVLQCMLIATNCNYYQSQLWGGDTIDK